MRRTFDRLPTAAKLLLLISLTLLPIGLALVWAARSGIAHANATLDKRAEEQDQAAARAVESLIARNALALRIAASGALATPGSEDCDEAQRSLAVAPAISRNFSIELPDGSEHCTTAGFRRPTLARNPLAGGLALWIDPAGRALFMRVTVPGGTATAQIGFGELAAAARNVAPEVVELKVDDGVNLASLISTQQPTRPLTRAIRSAIASGNCRSMSPSRAIA